MVRKNVDHDGVPSSRSARINMSEEPTHLVGKASCPRCFSKDVVFKYYNNKNVAQPRYLCNTCKKHYTHGGTFRKSKLVSRVRSTPCTGVAEGGGERDLVQENMVKVETENKDVAKVETGNNDVNKNDNRGSTQRRETKHAHPTESGETRHKLDLPTKRKKATTLRAWVDNLVWQP